MKRITTLVFVLGVAALQACGASSDGGGGGGGTDAGTSNVTDTGARTDTGTSTRTDTGSTTPRDAGAQPMGNFGTCGRAVTQALCTCGNDQNCQNQALNNSPQDCQQCLSQAQGQCCPTQFMAFNSCVQTNMCTDLACARAQCGMQIGAFEMCLQTTFTAEAMAGGGRCTMLQVPCLGDLATMGAAACP